MIPLSNRVLIKPAVGTLLGNEGGIAARQIEGSAVLRPADTVKFKPTEGIVMALGETVKVPIVVGDRVLFRWWTGLEFRLDGEDVVMTEEQHVLAKTQPGETIA